ncbi:serine/threonine-protein phosphatase [Puteibacter caeruleilacunae]|nr:serine/threonine-protein phosphatase [Puteibacter caeruleilacunae]
MTTFHTDIELLQRSHYKETTCGDIFQAFTVGKDGRRIIVLSDGMGHGVKANVLAALTSTMALKYTKLNTRPEIAAEIIMRTLPKTADDKDSYATFTIIEIESDGKVMVVNYENPPIIFMRGRDELETKRWEKEIPGEENRGKKLEFYEFKGRKEDRIIFYSDGISQSGMGSKRYPWGWGNDRVLEFIEGQISHFPNISAQKLCRKILNQATMNDDQRPKDDISCGVIYLRQPREVLVVTGPPFYKAKDRDFSFRVNAFQGKRVICGGTTAEIIARELQLEVEMEQHLADPSLPPRSKIRGFDLVTEGILTMGKVEEILENYSADTRLHENPAEQVVSILLQHDIIHLLVGTRINWAHQDPDQPIELEIRKFVVKRLVRLLEEKFFKQVKVEFV